MAELQIFVSRSCGVCEYAREVAQSLRRDYPAVAIEVVEMDDPQARIPETVFATPTYILDGRVWSLGNPSPEKILETFGPPQASQLPSA